MSNIPYGARSSQSARNQRAVYDDVSRKIAQTNDTFLEMLPTLKRHDLEQLIAKRPALWGRFSHYLTNGHVFADNKQLSHADDSRRGNYLPSKKDLAAMATPAKKTKSTPKSLPKCQCGCGHHTKGGRFIPGHDAKLKSKIIALAESGKVAQAKKIAADQGWSGLNLADRAKK